MSETVMNEEMNTDFALSVLEGLLYITGDEGLTAAQAAKALETEEDKAEALLDELAVRYEDNHGIELVHYGNVYRFVSCRFDHAYAETQLDMEKTA